MAEEGRVSAPPQTRDRSEPRLGAVLSAGLASALLFSVSLFLPVLFLVAIVSPFPLIVQRLRGGMNGLMSAVVATAVLAAVFTPGQAVAFLLVLAAPGLLIGEAMARGRGLRRGCGWAFALLSAQISLALLWGGSEMSEHILTPLDQYRSPRFLEEMKSGGLPPERVADWAEQVGELRDAIAVVFPAAYIILGGLVVLANGALLRAYLARRDPGWLDGGEFERIRWPFPLAVAFVLSGAGVAFPLLRPAAYNALLVLAFFFALQGLAVVAFYARRLAGPPLLRAAVVVLVLVNPWAPQILALLGLFDMWFDFRKWAEPPAAKQG